MTYLKMIVLSAITILCVNSVYATPIVFINEIHYDNTGIDTNEFVEITGIAGTDLKDWSLLFYNGNDGKQYDTYTFTSSNVIANQSNGFGTLGILVPRIQNGRNDGIALVDTSKAVIQFLSYEGILTASNGIAAGMTSQDIGVSESESTATTGSLQLIGSGDDYSDFHWKAFNNTNTFGQVNTEQTFFQADSVCDQCPETCGRFRQISAKHHLK